MPETFRSFVIEAGQPLKGYDGAPKELKGANMLIMNARQDDVVPPKGGVDDYNEWIYTPTDTVVAEWAKVQGCDESSWSRITTPYDDYITDNTRKGYNLHCFEYTKGCAGRVMNCLYYGKHAKYVAYDAQLVNWFLPWFKNEEETPVSSNFI